MRLPATVSAILRSAAPTLLTALALPPPFNVIAAGVVSAVMAKYLPAEEVAQNPASASGTPVLAPEQVVQAVERNAGNPQFTLELRQAEAELRRYETEAGIRFAEIELRDRQRASDFQRETGISDKVFGHGMKLVTYAIVGMIIVIAGSLVLVFGGIHIDERNANVSVAAFGLIGTAVGFINGLASNVVNFYWGSSQGSQDKSVAIADTVRNLGEQLGKTAVQPVYAPAAAASSNSPTLQDLEPVRQTGATEAPAVPAPSGLLAELKSELTASHKHFEDGVSWALTKLGISVEDAEPSGTAGQPTTVRNIWKRYGDLCSASAKRYGVPVELIVATIATESGGNPNARRPEPRIRDESIGLMQTLVATARGALGRRDLKGDNLLDPALSIEAGTAYIAQQRSYTHFDPPLVAAAYNAGSIRRDDASANRWKLVCYPKGTGRHVDNFVAWFSDCMRVSAEQNWGNQEGVPSFAACFVEEAKEAAE